MNHSDFVVGVKWNLTLAQRKNEIVILVVSNIQYNVRSPIAYLDDCDLKDLLFCRPCLLSETLNTRMQELP